jgi:hypothetical protein
MPTFNAKSRNSVRIQQTVIEYLVLALYAAVWRWCIPGSCFVVWGGELVQLHWPMDVLCNLENSLQEINASNGYNVGGQNSSLLLLRFNTGEENSVTLMK